MKVTQALIVNRGVVCLTVFFFSLPVWASQELTWVDCLRLASQNHPDLVSAKETVRQVKDDKVITTSAYLPQVNGDLSVNRANSSNGAGLKSKANTYSYGVSGSQLLFDGFKTTNNIKAASQNIKSSEASFQYVSSQVRLRLKTAYVNLLKAQELIQLTQEIYKLRKQNLDLITLKYNSGTEHKGALLTAQANLKSAEFEIHQSERAVVVAQRNLLKEIGSKSDDEITIKGSFEMDGVYEKKPSFKDLVHTNPQLLKIIAQKNAASYGVGASQGNYWPSVSLTGGADKSDDRWTPRAGSADVGVKLNWPLFTGGATSADVDKAKSVVRGLEAQEQSLQDGLILQLEQAWSSLEDAREQVGVQKEFLTAAEERAKIAQGQYSVGLINFDNWTIIEDDLVINKKSFLNTQANALIAEANWIAAQGRTLEYAN